MTHRCGVRIAVPIGWPRKYALSDLTSSHLRNGLAVGVIYTSKARQT